MAKNSVALGVSIYVPSFETLVGTIENVDASGVTITHKRPRSSKFDTRFIPATSIVAFMDNGDAGYVTHITKTGLVDTVVGEISEAGEGMVSVATENGDVVINTNVATLEAVAEAEEAAPKKKSAPAAEGGKKKKKKKA